MIDLIRGIIASVILLILFTIAARSFLGFVGYSL